MMADLPGAAGRELAEMFRKDQADRKAAPPKPWSAVNAADRERRVRVREIVRQGQLQSAEDYFHAALILQHGETAEDFLDAHILAMVAAFQGHSEGRWLSAATLDRFLLEIGRPQRLGSNYQQAANGPVTQEPYDRSLPDSIRQEYGLPTLAEQQERLEEMNG